MPDGVCASHSLPAQVPPIGKGSLYLRPLLIGSGPILGLGPAPSYTFTVFAAAVGAYFKVRLRYSAHACRLGAALQLLPLGCSTAAATPGCLSRLSIELIIWQHSHG